MNMSRFDFCRRLSPLLVLFIVACATTSGMDQSRGETLKQYEAVIRWSEWDGAVNYLAPDYLEEHPITRLELDRLRLFRVTGYEVRSTQIYDEGITMTQVVEISLFHKSQAVEKSIVDEQIWRYDEESQVWLLHSGLPDPTKSRY